MSAAPYGAAKIETFSVYVSVNLETARLRLLNVELRVRVAIFHLPFAIFISVSVSGFWQLWP